MLLLLAAAPSRADSVSGETSVVLNSSTVTALSGMGLSISGLGQTTFNSSTLTFFIPITTGTIGASGDVFNMDGNGFALTAGSTDITFRNLTINTATDTITGNVHFGNTQANDVTIFDIGSGGVLTLDAQAAGKISAAFGVSNLSGTNVGSATVLIPLLGGIGGGAGTTTGSGTSTSSSTATIATTATTSSVTSTPEPTALVLLAVSALALGVFSFLRVPGRQLRSA